MQYRQVRRRVRVTKVRDHNQFLAGCTKSRHPASTCAAIPFRERGVEASLSKYRCYQDHHCLICTSPGDSIMPGILRPYWEILQQRFERRLSFLGDGMGVSDYGHENPVTRELSAN